MEKVLVICGPTATGKTSLAFNVAKYFDQVSIISVDSRQVYQELNIVSGKDLPVDLPSNIHFFGLDIWKPTDRANLSEYVDLIRKTITTEVGLRRKVILVGGTGLYLKGITDDLSDISVPQDPKIREELEKLSVVNLQEKLRKVDSIKFNKLNNSDLNNPRRLIRYLEIALNKNGKKNISPVPNVNFIWIGLLPSKDQLSAIRNRVLERLKNNAIEEVKNLIEKYKDLKLPIFTALGVSEIVSYLNHEINMDQLVELWTRNEFNYSKRQMVWFKKQPQIFWYDETIEKNVLANTLAQKLKQNA